MERLCFSNQNWCLVSFCKMSFLASRWYFLGYENPQFGTFLKKKSGDFLVLFYLKVAIFFLFFFLEMNFRSENINVHLCLIHELGTLPELIKGKKQKYERWTSFTFCICLSTISTTFSKSHQNQCLFKRPIKPLKALSHSMVFKLSFFTGSKVTVKAYRDF